MIAFIFIFELSKKRKISMLAFLFFCPEDGGNMPYRNVQRTLIFENFLCQYISSLWTYRKLWSRGSFMNLYWGGSRISFRTPLSQAEILRGCSHLLQANSGILSQSEHNSFLPNYLHFIIHSLSYHSKLYNANIVSVSK
jgi:hypothetical protein